MGMPHLLNYLVLVPEYPGIYMHDIVGYVHATLLGIKVTYLSRNKPGDSRK